MKCFKTCIGVFPQYQEKASTEKHFFLHFLTDECTADQHYAFTLKAAISGETQRSVDYFTNLL